MGYCEDTGEIVAGERAGSISLSDTMNGIVEKFRGRPVHWEERPYVMVLHADPYKIWVDKRTQAIDQILVGKGFDGKFLLEIGIGSTLRDVVRVAGSYNEQGDAYHLDAYPGICFELEDVGDWEEETAPIEFISVFPVG